MPCVKLPEFPPLPDISPFSIDLQITLPPVDLSVDFCCRLNLLQLPPLPLGLLAPLILSAPESVTAILTGINAALKLVDTLIDALPLDCPFD